jgi:hypothetical protein
MMRHMLIEVLQRGLVQEDTREWLGHFKARMTTAVPMNDKVKLLGFIVQVDDDLVNQGAGDLLFQHHRAGGIIPNRSKVYRARR